MIFDAFIDVTKRGFSITTQNRSAFSVFASFLRGAIG